MSYAHNHDHCTHSHAPASFGKAFAVGIILNLAFVIAEIVYGLQSNSMALIADAGHNASDVLGLFLAWGASYLALKLPSAKFTYGLRSSSILTALINAVTLLIAIGAIALESIQRFARPTPVLGSTVIVVALIGVVVNGITAYMFMSGRKSDLNIRAAFLHMAGDAAISLGVALTGIAIIYTGKLWLDPLVSLAICVIILISTWGLLKDSAKLALQAVPEGIDSEAVKIYLKTQPGIKEVHDLHIWALSTNESALSVHLIMPGGHPGDKFLDKLRHALGEKFKITHTTIQIEIGNTDIECKQAPEHVV